MDWCVVFFLTTNLILDVFARVKTKIQHTLLEKYILYAIHL